MFCHAWRVLASRVPRMEGTGLSVGDNDNSVLQSAYLLSDLPRKDIPEIGNPLGNEYWDNYVFKTLADAGIDVQVVKPSSDVNEVRHSSVQVVSDLTIASEMRNCDMKKVRFADSEDMLGLQVKLAAGYQWKVSIANDNQECHSKRSVGAKKRSTSQEAKGSTAFTSHNLCEIAILDPTHGMRCTAALAMVITIYIAFKTKDDEGGEALLTKENFHHVLQRRIDVTYINKHLCTTQVRLATCTAQIVHSPTEHVRLAVRLCSSTSLLRTWQPGHSRTRR